MIESEPHAQAEFRVIFKERITPRRPTPVIVSGVRSRRQIATVDARTTGRIRDDRSIAKQLGQQFDVRGFPTTLAGAGELEQRLQQLHVLHGVECNQTILVQVGER